MARRVGSAMAWKMSRLIVSLGINQQPFGSKYIRKQSVAQEKKAAIFGVICGVVRSFGVIPGFFIPGGLAKSA
jgi:hypothetical protein